MLIVGVMWGKGYRIRAARYEIEVVFDNVSGLEDGCNVLANGVLKGRVTSIVLHEGRVTVRAAVDKSVTLYSDYRITIESPTVMAGKVLALYPGSKTPVADVSRPLKGQPPLGVAEAVGIFESVSENVQTALHNLNALMINLNLIVGDSANRDNISGLLSNAHGAARTSNDWLRDNRDDLTESIAQLKTTLDAAELMIHNLESRMDNTFTGVDSVVTQLNSLTASLRVVMDQVNNKEGTLGKLVGDEELYLRLNRTLAEVDSLAKAIRAKGIKTHISLF